MLRKNCLHTSCSLSGFFSFSPSDSDTCPSDVLSYPIAPSATTERSMNIPSRGTGSAQEYSPPKEANRDDDPSSALDRAFQALSRVQGAPDRVYQAFSRAHDAQLWHFVMRQLQHVELFLILRRKDLAIRSLAATRKFCDDFKGTEAMYHACQDTEDIIRHWPGSAADARRSSLRRRHSASRLESPKLSHQNAERVDSPEILFERLMLEVQTGAETPCTPSSQQQPLQTPFEYTQQEATPSHSSPKSEGSFEPIEVILPRLRQGGKWKDESSQPVAPSHYIETMRPDTAQLFNGWEAHLPNSPSSFKDSEEPSPRRHSFPYASPHNLGSPSLRKARKASIHSQPQPLIGHEPGSLSNAPVSAWGSASNYLRRPSQNETSSVLSDTPSLTKLASQIHTNHFTEGQSIIGSRVRKLSIDDSTSEALSTGNPSLSENPDSPPRSPLSQTFTPEDLQPEPVAGPSSPHLPQGRKGPPPPLLNTISRQSGSASSSPHNPSPLREEFSASERAPASKEEASSPAQEALHRRTPSSRIPRPTRRSSQPSSPILPTALAHESINSPPAPTASANPHVHEHPPLSPTSTNQTGPVLVDTPISPSTSSAATATANTSATTPSHASPPSAHRRRNTASRVSRMAAQLEDKSPSAIAATAASRSNASATTAATAHPSSARPPWQMPGRTMTRGTANGQAGFVKWGREMVHRGPGPGPGQGSGSGAARGS